jgi:hypothetical protein
MNNVKFIVAVSLCATLCACANIKGQAPASIAFYKGSVAVGVTAKSAKHGESCAENYLGLIATGDASIDAAKKHGSITKVSSVDHSSTRILGYYAKFCTVVTGE